MGVVRELVSPQGHRFWVETDPDVEIAAPAQTAGQAGDLMHGAEKTSVGGALKDAAASLIETIEGAAEIVREALSKAAPVEVTLEISIGFKGKVDLVPVIVSGSSEGAMKIIAKWKSAT
jgi:hypothetical protein